MTMFDNNFPASSYYYYYCSDQNLCGQHFDGLGHGYRGLMNQLEHQGFPQSYYNKSAGCLVGSDNNLADTVMAEDESRTESVNDEAGPSYSKDVLAATTAINRGEEEEEDDQKGWLQLSIGGGGGGSASAAASGRENNGREGLGLVELDLLPPGPRPVPVPPPQYPFSAAAGAGVEFRAPPPPHFALTNSVAAPGAAVGYISAAPSYFLQQQQQPGGSDMNWAIRPAMAIPAPGVSAPSSSASPFMYAPPLSGSRFAPRPGAFPLLYAGVGGVGAGGSSPSLEFRVIDPPRRPLSGIWFSLQASQNQAKEPFLPQISKSYLRIKDGSMTIRLVLKYLVNKLQLDNESEIEIRCRGQELPPSLTLQHVRDEIWMNNSNNNNEHPPPFTLLPHPSTSATTNHHVMLLLYGRKSSSSSTA
ncbi:protein LAX PANICLE 2 isoform X2 [Ipomoea triloba]|uniref:protein LAX PANICLE 2 isoform X2 n=1 Tax=Ipomoea triloba TaxID=35885 RepID=UPI00125D2B3D|nr:protein LAX PANICLE 2 isoform X2 [Ipomoea triloba]